MITRGTPCLRSVQRPLRGEVRALLAVSISMLALAAPAPAAPPPPEYVSLGDSYTAGPLIPLQIPPFGCLKSNNNYPHLTARNLGLALKDPSCSGAETEDMTNPQDVDPDGPNPPQFDSLTKKTAIVTLQIGGNDIGFSSISRDCTSTTNQGTPCQDRYVHDGHDEISDRIAATALLVDKVLDGISARSPKARVLVVNYAAILPDEGPGCWPQVPITDGDVPYVRAKQKELNGMLAGQAAANGAELIDWYAASIGHDACKLPVVRWVEPAVPVNSAAPLHPNLGGMIGASELLTAALR